MFDSYFIHWGMSSSKGEYVGANEVFEDDEVDHIDQMSFSDNAGMYDREGTRAAAVTAIETLDCACAIEPEDIVYVTLDRPFVYGIIDNATGLPVFLGTVNQL